MSAETVEQIRRIFNAESVALVGATDKEGSFGRLFLEGMRDAGCKKLYPVNPKREEVLGIKAYPSISAIPEQVDAAILAHPARRGAGAGQGVRRQPGGRRRGLRLGLRRDGCRRQGARARDRPGRPRGRHARHRSELPGLLQPRGRGRHLSAGAHEGRPHRSRHHRRLLAERLVRGLPGVVPLHQRRALQQRGELRQRVRPGRRGLPRVPGRGREHQDHRVVHGGRQGRPALLRGRP